MNDMDEDDEQARSPLGAAQLRLRRLLEKVKFHFFFWFTSAYYYCIIYYIVSSFREIYRTV